ncbi:hypothetical protein D3C72_2346240 [compost metagenome]
MAPAAAVKVRSKLAGVMTVKAPVPSGVAHAESARMAPQAISESRMMTPSVSPRPKMYALRLVANFHSLIALAQD